MLQKCVTESQYSLSNAYKNHCLAVPEITSPVEFMQVTFTLLRGECICTLTLSQIQICVRCLDFTSQTNGDVKSTFPQGVCKKE